METWLSSALPPRRLAAKLLLCGVLSLSGLLAYSFYLWLKFGHPLAFVASQDAFNAESLSSRLLSALTLRTFTRAAWQESAELAIFLGLTAWSFNHLRFSLAVYGLGAIMMPYFMLGVGASTGRYLMMCIPAFLQLGIMCRTRPWTACGLTFLLAVFLFRKTALFSQWYWQG